MTLTNNQTRKIVTLGILTALGVGLMILEIPYPLGFGLMVDLSDVVVLIVFVIYGWKEAALVGLLKAVVHIMAKGPVMGPIPIPIGQITAFAASMSYVLAMYVAMYRLKLNKYMSAVLSAVIVTIIMTVLNYFFITPIFIGVWWYTEIPFPITPETYGITAQGGYLLATILLYVPFNLLKAAIITPAFIVIYEAIKRAYPELLEKQ